MDSPIVHSQVYAASKDHLSGGTDEITVLPNPMDSDARGPKSRAWLKALGTVGKGRR